MLSRGAEQLQKHFPPGVCASNVNYIGKRAECMGRLQAEPTPSRGQHCPLPNGVTAGCGQNGVCYIYYIFYIY